MPIYIYLNEKTGETKEIVQSMVEPHIYKENGIEWARVFSIPQSSISTYSKLNPFSSQAFINKTNRGPGTIGELWDASKELSEKRKERLGFDPIKEKQLTAYEKKCGGKKHPLAKEPVKIPTADIITKKIMERITGS